MQFCFPGGRFLVLRSQFMFSHNPQTRPIWLEETDMELKEDPSSAWTSYILGPSILYKKVYSLNIY